MRRLVTVMFIFSVATMCTACANYKSSFACPSSKGANCMPMDMVDGMISNGQISEYNEKHRKRNCNNARCYHNFSNRR